jgi:hypothetical protein
VGQAFQFASTSDAIAIWNGVRLEFYTLGWAKPDQPFADVTLLKAVPLQEGAPAQNSVIWLQYATVRPSVLA